MSSSSYHNAHLECSLLGLGIGCTLVSPSRQPKHAPSVLLLTWIQIYANRARHAASSTSPSSSTTLPPLRDVGGNSGCERRGDGRDEE